VTEILRRSTPGRYHIDEVSTVPLPSGQRQLRTTPADMAGSKFNRDTGRV
jgi:hypothetical protein